MSRPEKIKIKITYIKNNIDLLNIPGHTGNGVYLG
jgi:hypothetical protein